MSNRAPSKRIYHPSGDPRAHIIDVASSLFYARGIRAVGVDEIIHEAQIARATLYRHFAGKDELIIAYLKKREDQLVQAMQTKLFDEAASPAMKILSVFEDLRGKENSAEFRGCAFFLALSEYGEVSEVREISFRYKEFIRDFFDGLLSAQTKHDLADQIALIYEGVLATLVVRPHTRAVDHALACATALLEVNGLLAGQAEAYTQQAREVIE